jgi:hypothetical protein
MADDRTYQAVVISTPSGRPPPTPVSDSSSDELDTDFASDDPEAAPPGPGGKPGKTTTVKKDKEQRREAIVRERGDRLTEADLGHSLHDRLAAHIRHLPTEELEIRHAPPSLADLRDFRRLVGDHIDYVGPSTYAIDAVLSRLFLLTDEAALFLRPRRKLKNVYMAWSMRSLAGGQAGLWVASAYYRLVDCHWVILVGTPSGSSVHLDCGIAMEPKEQVIRLTPCRTTLKHVALLRVTWMDLQSDPLFWNGRPGAYSHTDATWRVEYPPDLRDLTRLPYDRPPPGYGPDGLPIRNRALAMASVSEIPPPAPPARAPIPPPEPPMPPADVHCEKTGDAAGMPGDIVERSMNPMAHDTPDDLPPPVDGQGWDMRHPDVAWVVRRVVDGVESLVLGADSRTISELADTQIWDPGYFWPCRAEVVSGHILQGVLQDAGDFVTGWRLTVQWLRTHPDADVALMDTVLGELIDTYPWHEAAMTPQICALHWNRPALVQLFEGVYLALNHDRDAGRPVIDVTLVIANSIPHVSAVTPIRPARGRVKAAVVGREWTVVSYCGPPCFVTPLPLRAFVAMLIESYTIPLACDGIRALTADAEWIVKTLW